MELVINGTSYEFNFGIGFVREIDKTVQRPVDGVPNIKENVGLTMAVSKILSGDVVTLVDVLLMGNKGKNPRITKDELEAYIDDEETNIEELFDKVIDFFRNANSCKIIVKRLEDAIKMELKKMAN